MYIYAILYKSCSITQIIFNKYANKTENDDIPQPHRSLRISGLLLLCFFYVAFLLDIIENIITYCPYCRYYVTRTSVNGSAVYWSRDFRLYRYCTSIG